VRDGKAIPEQAKPALAQGMKSITFEKKVAQF
jgi:hypothetical protein